MASSGSTYSYWAFCWDDAGRLWVWNSDIGGALVAQDSSGAWQTTAIKSLGDQDYRETREIYRQMPIELYDRLPATVKKAIRRR